jgi:hypothetical protein
VTVDASNLTLKVNIADTSLTSLAGDYSITINPKTPTGTAITGKTLTVTLTINEADPATCEPPTSVTVPTLAAQSYYIGDAE